MKKLTIELVERQMEEAEELVKEIAWLEKQVAQAQKGIEKYKDNLRYRSSYIRDMAKDSQEMVKKLDRLDQLRQDIRQTIIMGYRVATKEERIELSPIFDELEDKAKEFFGQI